MASANVSEFTDSNFEADVLGSDLPVIVDFWAEWCGPCRAISPLVEQLAVKYAGKLKVGKVNVDHNPQIAQKYRIASIPTLMVFRNGSLASQIIGGNPNKIKNLFEGAV